MNVLLYLWPKAGIDVRVTSDILTFDMSDGLRREKQAEKHHRIDSAATDDDLRE